MVCYLNNYEHNELLVGNKVILGEILCNYWQLGNKLGNKASQWGIRQVTGQLGK